MNHEKKTALVAHESKKRDLLEWAKYNRALLSYHTLYATWTTGATLERVLDLKVHRLQSVPLGRDPPADAEHHRPVADYSEYRSRHANLMVDEDRSTGTTA